MSSEQRPCVIWDDLVREAAAQAIYDQLTPEDLAGVSTKDMFGDEMGALGVVYALLAKAHRDGVRYKYGNYAKIMFGIPDDISGTSVNSKQYLSYVGFEVDGSAWSSDPTVLQGTAPVPPAFAALSAFSVTGVLWFDGKRHTGAWLICQDPGTGNVVQAFDLNENGKQVV